MKVLYLSAWYPHRYDAMWGLFVRKHAEAVSRFADVCVLYLMADEKVDQFDIVEQTTNSVREVYVYYPFTNKPVLRQLTKAVGYVRAFRRGLAVVRQNFGLPDVAQANVLTRSGVLAYWLKRKFGIPYIIVEHWTRYLPQNLNYKGIARKCLTRICVKNASCVLAVSNMLRDAMQKCGLKNNNYQIIDNVVDDFFYETHKSNTEHRFRFLHISCFEEPHKNVKGILNATKSLLQQRTDFELILIGVGADWKDVVQYAKELGLSDSIVHFVGEQTPMEVCRYFAESYVLVMFSRYETAGITFCESWATGTPVITTQVGIIPDCLTPQNGIIVQNENETDLCEKMLWMIDNHGQFDAEKIRQTALRYTYNNVGKRLYDVYCQVTGKTNAIINK